MANVLFFEIEPYRVIEIRFEVFEVVEESVVLALNDFFSVSLGLSKMLQSSGTGCLNLKIVSKEAVYLVQTL